MKSTELKFIDQLEEALEEVGFDLESPYFYKTETDLDDFVNNATEDEKEYDFITVTFNEPDIETQLQGYNLELLGEISPLPNEENVKPFYINCFIQLP